MSQEGSSLPGSSWRTCGWRGSPVTRITCPWWREAYLSSASPIPAGMGPWRGGTSFQSSCPGLRTSSPSDSSGTATLESDSGSKLQRKVNFCTLQKKKRNVLSSDLRFCQKRKKSSVLSSATGSCIPCFWRHFTCSMMWCWSKFVLQVQLQVQVQTRCEAWFSLSQWSCGSQPSHEMDSKLPKTIPRCFLPFCCQNASQRQISQWYCKFQWLIATESHSHQNSPPKTRRTTLFLMRILRNLLINWLKIRDFQKFVLEILQSKIKCESDQGY